jgi:glycine cleavage system aminomethyltransferase T
VGAGADTLCAVSVTARSQEAPAPLDLVLRRAGAVLSVRDGRPVAVNFGSAAAELAVCVRTVGLVDRSDLQALALEAPPAQLSALMTRVAGATVLPGGLAFGAGAWWCGEAPDRVIVVCDQRTGARLAGGLRAVAARHVTVRDLSSELTAIGLLGRHTGRVLAALGMYGPAGDPRHAKPFARGSVQGIPACWLLQSDHRALVLVAPEQAGAAWLAIERAGREHGISCVGQEAAARYALMERLRPATLPFV